MKIKEIPKSVATLFEYHPITGEVTRKVRAGNYAAGSVLRARTSDGRYYTTKVQGVTYLLHRIVYYLHTGEQPPEVLDHVDGNGRNNAWSNLRHATTSQNQQNINATSKSTTGLKGVFPIRGGALYRAEVCIDSKRYQKHSVDPKKLEVWVTAKRKELHGEFASN